MTKLEELPGRIDDLTLQVSQLRTEMRAEFSAVRAEIAERATGSEMRALHEDVHQPNRAVAGGVGAAAQAEVAQEVALGWRSCAAESSYRAARRHRLVHSPSVPL